MGSAHQVTDPGVFYPEVVVGLVNALNRKRRVRIGIGSSTTRLNLLDFFRRQELAGSVFCGALHGHIGGKIPDTLKIRLPPLRSRRLIRILRVQRCRKANG